MENILLLADELFNYEMVVLVHRQVLHILRLQIEQVTIDNSGCKAFLGTIHLHTKEQGLEELFVRVHLLFEWRG